jgi:hypothetical protein
VHVNYPDVDLCVPSYNVIKNVMDTIPGGADQSVSPAYYALLRGSQTPDADVPYVDFRPAVPQSSYAGLRQAEIDAGAVPSALTDAENFHASDLSWPSQVPGTISIIAGTGECTVSQIHVQTVYQGSGPFGLGSPFGQTKVTQYDFQASDGDDTVTRVSASFDDGRMAGPFKGHIYYMVGTHSDLGNSSDALAAAYALLGRDSGPLPNDLYTTPQPARGCLTISLHSPMELRVTDASGNQLGTLNPNDPVDDQIPGGTYQRIGDMKLATLEQSGSYQVAVQGTGAGQATIKLRFRTTTSTVGTEVVFEGMPTTAHTTGSFTANAATGAVSPLTLDVNGDGRHVLTLHPTILSGDSANDYTPPSIQITSPHAQPAVSETVSVAWTASDTQSGVKQSVAVIDQGTPQQQVLTAPGTIHLPVGDHTLDIYAEDKADNQATAHVTFTVATNRPADNTGFLGHVGGVILFAPIVVLMGGVAVVVYRRRARRAR